MSKSGKIGSEMVWLGESQRAARAQAPAKPAKDAKKATIYVPDRADGAPPRYGTTRSGGAESPSPPPAKADRAPVPPTQTKGEKAPKPKAQQQPKPKAQQPQAKPQPKPQPQPQPKPQPKTESRIDPADATAQSRVLAHTVVHSFVERLTAEAQKRGGVLGVDDIQALSREMERKTAALEKVFEKSFAEYMSARERATWDKARRFPFDRLIVKTFSHLFPGEGGRPLEKGGISRRFLPGFFIAMNKMLGPEGIEEYQQKVRDIVEDLRRNQDGRFEWADLYKDTRSATIVEEALVAILPYFADLRKREDWFAGIVNANLPPADDMSGEGEAAAHWQLGNEAFLNFIEALFANLRRHVASTAGKRALDGRFGAGTADAVLALEADIAELRKAG